MVSLINNLGECIERYRCLLEPWEPDILSATETGSRVVYTRDAIEEILSKLGGKVNLHEQLAEVRRLDAFMREHAAEIWQWCKYDCRDIEREEEKIPISRWWWYLDKPEVWPPLEPV